MKVFLAGSFRTKETEKRLKKIYRLLTKNGYRVWWAPKKVTRCYECRGQDLLKEVGEIEEKAIENSDLLVAVMERASFGTAMEIKHAFDHQTPVIAYLVSDHPDFSSGSFRYRVKKIVRDDQELLKIMKAWTKKKKS